MSKMYVNQKNSLNFTLLVYNQLPKRATELHLFVWKLQVLCPFQNLRLGPKFKIRPNIIKMFCLDLHVWWNEQNKVTIGETNFMTEDKILRAMKGIKLKNFVGIERIPQRILLTGMEILLKPMAYLFNLIYTKNV